MASPVTVENIDEIAVITINNRPVNALGHIVRSASGEANRVSHFLVDVKVIVTTAEGKNFIGGVKIREIGSSAQSPFLAENISQCPPDIDVVLKHGYDLPRWRCGTMTYADSIGLDKILADIKEFANEDDLFWKPSPILVDLVAKGANFDALNNT